MPLGQNGALDFHGVLLLPIHAGEDRPSLKGPLELQLAERPSCVTYMGGGLSTVGFVFDRVP